MGVRTSVAFTKTPGQAARVELERSPCLARSWLAAPRGSRRRWALTHRACTGELAKLRPSETCDLGSGSDVVFVVTSAGRLDCVVLVIVLLAVGACGRLTLVQTAQTPRLANVNVTGIDFAAPGYGVITTTSGVLETFDGGSSWSRLALTGSGPPKFLAGGQ